MLYLICGKICSGKSHYARALAQERRAVILSCDEVSMALFDGQLGDAHDVMMVRVKRYLHKKAAEICSTGVDVILDWGFWIAAEREQVSAHYDELGIDYQWHYIDISDVDWQENIRQRNAAVLAGQSSDYYVDDGLMAKLRSLFEPPEKDSMDTWYSNER